MATHRLTIIIEAGEKTCSIEPGKFCSQVRVRRMGSQYVCGLFDHAELRDENNVLSGPGTLQRLPQCMAAGGGS